MSGFAFEEHKGYCVVRFETQLHEMSWGDVEKEAADVVQKLKAANTARMIVDLSPMDLIQSGLVASLVRMWKATEGHSNRKVVVVAPSEVVREVIRSAGLFKVFTVVDSREEGAYEIGVSKGAQVEQREKRVLAFVALPAAVLAVVSLYPLLTSPDSGIKDHAQLAAVLLATFACMTSVFSMAKDEGWRRGMGVLAMVLGLGVIGAAAMNYFNGEEDPGDLTEHTEQTESEGGGASSGGVLSGGGSAEGDDTDAPAENNSRKDRKKEKSEGSTESDSQE